MKQFSADTSGETLIIWLDTNRVERFKLNNRARQRVRELRGQGYEVSEDRYGDFAVSSNDNGRTP